MTRLKTTAVLLASIGLGLTACVPTSGPRSIITSPAPAAASPTSAAVAQPTAGATTGAAGAPAVNIVEPPFRPPQAWAYAPAALSVKVGTAVTWTNSGAVAHTVTADDGTSFDSGRIAPKQTFTLAPSKTGTFAYHCTFHPWMKATLTVTP